MGRKVSITKMKSQGFTLLEILITILLLIFAIIGLSKGMLDYLQFLNDRRLQSVAKELGERLRSEVQGSLNYTTIRNCFSNLVEGNLISNDTNTWLTCDNDTFYVDTCPFVTGSCSELRCLFCYVGGRLEPSSNSTTCSRGYPIRVGYNACKVIDPTSTYQELGLAVGIKVYFNETKTKRRQEIRFLVFKPYEP